MSKLDKNWRRASLKDERESQARKSLTQSKSANSFSQIKCRVVAQYLPGEETPFEDDASLDLNTWRVSVQVEDASAGSWSTAVKNKTFVVQEDPDVIMLNYGSHGLIDSVVLLKFQFPNLRATGEVYPSSQTSFGVNDRIDASDVHIAQSLDLGEVLNFSLG